MSSLPFWSLGLRSVSVVNATNWPFPLITASVMPKSGCTPLTMLASLTEWVWRSMTYASVSRLSSWGERSSDSDVNSTYRPSVEIDGV